MKNLVLLHGALGASSQFDSLASQLDKLAILWIPDLPMHGQNSDKLSPQMMELADYIIEKMDAMKWCQVPVFGYSMGGYLALMIATKRPDLFSKIVTLGTKIEWSHDVGIQQSSMLNPEIMESKVPTYALYLNSLHVAYSWKEVVKYTASLLINLSANPPLQMNSMGRISIPCVFCLGDKDKMVGEHEAIFASQYVPGSKVKKIDNTPHPLEKVSTEILLNLCKEEFGL